MIEIIDQQFGYITKSSRKLVFIDGLFVGFVEINWKINPEHEAFIKEYETFDKVKRNTVTGPVRYLFDGYIPTVAYNMFDFDLPQLRYQILNTKEEVEQFFKKILSKESFSGISV